MREFIRGGEDLVPGLVVVVVEEDYVWEGCVMVDYIG